MLQSLAKTSILVKVQLFNKFSISRNVVFPSLWILYSFLIAIDKVSNGFLEFIKVVQIGKVKESSRITGGKIDQHWLNTRLNQSGNVVLKEEMLKLMFEINYN